MHKTWFSTYVFIEKSSFYDNRSISCAKQMKNDKNLQLYAIKIDKTTALWYKLMKILNLQHVYKKLNWYKMIHDTDMVLSRFTVNKKNINDGVNVNMDLIIAEWPSHYRLFLEPKILQQRHERIFYRVLDWWDWISPHQ